MAENTGKPAEVKTWLTTGELANRLALMGIRVSNSTIRKMCERGDIPGALRIGEWWRIPPKSANKILGGK